MANTPKQLAQALLGTSVSTLYTAPNVAGGYAFLENIIVVNTTTTRRTVRIYIVPSGGSPGTGNAIAYDFVLDIPGLPYLLPIKQIVGQNGTLRASCDSANGVTLTASGIEVQ